MSANLQQVVAATRIRLADTKRSSDGRNLEREAEKHVPRGFRRALETNTAGTPAIIAELKKASPSRGLIRPDFNPTILARDLERAGAVALSVLTDEEFFQGSLENLRIASASTNLPCLRKDFIVDEFQLLEARANHADAVLLIVAALTQAELEHLAQRAREYGLDVLCEVHDEEELHRAVQTGCQIIGVNSRDLRTFKVDLKTAERLAESLPHQVTRVAESGIHAAADIVRLHAAGYHAFLIGESLMKSQSPGAALRTLITESRELMSNSKTNKPTEVASS